MKGEAWLTLDHVTRSLVASSMAMITGCDMISSGKSIRAAYSMSAKQGLQPLVSRLTVMYDSRSGMHPFARSSACLATAMKNRSIVWMNRFVHPGPPVRTKRLKNLFSFEINFLPQMQTSQKKNARLGHQTPKLVGLKVDGIAEGADTGFPYSPRIRHVKFI